MSNMYIKEEDLIYAAGFIDGEGCFNINKNNFRVSLSISNTYKPIIQWFNDNFGGYLNKKGRRKLPHHRPCYTWSVSDEKSSNIAKCIVPYLKEKQGQALLLIAIRQVVNNKNISKKEKNKEKERLNNIFKGTKHVTW